jgi:hypothetical protein
MTRCTSSGKTPRPARSWCAAHRHPRVFDPRSQPSHLPPGRDDGSDRDADASWGGDREACFTSPREKAKPKCPTCKGTKVVPQLAGFMAQTKKKSDGRRIGGEKPMPWVRRVDVRDTGPYPEPSFMPYAMRRVDTRTSRPTSVRTGRISSARARRRESKPRYSQRGLVPHGRTGDSTPDGNVAVGQWVPPKGGMERTRAVTRGEVSR